MTRFDFSKVRSEAPEPTAEQLAEIERHEAERARALRLKEESWERSDTDGFLSQWAHGLSADRERLAVQILRNGGHAKFWFLVEAATGRIVKAEQVYSERFRSHSWFLHPEEAERFGRKYVPCGGKSRVQRQLGLTEEQRWYPAKADIVGRGTGLSGSAWAAAVPLT